MAIAQQIAFILVLAAASFFIRKRVLRLRDNIQLGKKADANDDPKDR